MSTASWMLCYVSDNHLSRAATAGNRSRIERGSGLFNVMYNHEDEVRFNDGYMKLSKDWQWFIDLSETASTPDTTIKSFVEFANCFRDIEPFYSHLCLLVEHDLDDHIVCKKEWTARVLGAARIWAGKSALPSTSSACAFFDILDIIAFSTRMLNQLSDERSIYNMNLCVYRNLGQLYDFSELADESDRLVEALARVEVTDADEPLAVLKDNLDMVTVPCETQAVLDMLDNCFGANYLGFHHSDKSLCGTWQESLLFDMTMTKLEDGILSPAISFRRGGQLPEFNRWTPEILG